MKKKSHLLALIALFATHSGLVGAESSAPSSRIERKQDASKPKKVELSDDQRQALSSYAKFRKQVIFMRSLSDNATTDDIRRDVAPVLGLAKDAGWSVFMEHHWIKPHLTEERRVKYSQIFCGHKNATWVDILNAVELLRKRRDAGEVAQEARRQVSPFLFDTLYHLDENK